MRLRTWLAALGCLLALGGVVLAAGGLGSTDSAPAGAAQAVVLDGAQLFAAKGCAACHDGPDSQSPIQAGPPLVDAASWAAARRPGLDASAYLGESIREPGAFVSPAAPPGAVMPVLALSDAEIDLIVRYLLEP